MFDVLVIDTGSKRLTLSTGNGLRPVIRDLAAILTRPGQEADMIETAGHLQGTLTQQAAPLTVIAALLATAALLVCYAGTAIGMLLLGGE